MTERKKINVGHKTWRGGGFRCETCGQETGAPQAHAGDDLLWCLKCNDWRAMAEVSYVPVTPPTMRLEDFERMTVLWDQRDTPSGGNRSLERRMVCYQDATGVEWIVDFANNEWRHPDGLRDEWHPLEGSAVPVGER